MCLFLSLFSARLLSFLGFVTPHYSCGILRCKYQRLHSNSYWVDHSLLVASGSLNLDIDSRQETFAFLALILISNWWLRRFNLWPKIASERDGETKCLWNSWNFILAFSSPALTALFDLELLLLRIVVLWERFRRRYNLLIRSLQSALLTFYSTIVLGVRLNSPMGTMSFSNTDLLF